MRLIDADELRNELSNKDYITYTYEHGDAIPVDWVIGAIDNAPTAEITEEQAIDKLHDTGWLPLHDKEMMERPTDKWISVSERLPEGKIDPMTNDFELVLCSTVWDVVRPYKFGKPKGHAKAHFWSGGGIMDDYVIAWMPLPESYKEAEDDTLN